ncbi:MAG: aldolase/citrate lyase family protein [bacterium]
MIREEGTLSASAGSRGEDVRSDCWVGIETAAPRETVVSSKVEVLYGESIRELTEEARETLSINGRLIIEDQGALPWVLSARLEAAARAAGTPGEIRLLPPRQRVVEDPRPARLRRSRLYLPGDTPKFMLNAALHGPDGVILDLEDSVAPGRKDQARLLVRNALRTVDFRSSEVMVRINQLPLGSKDLEVVVPQGPEMILIPKVEGPEQVRRVAESSRRLAGEADVPIPLLMPIIESARGVLAALEIAEADPQVAALTIGLEDYTAELGVERTAEGRESLWARSRIVNAATAAGVQPIDTVFSDVDDVEGLRASVREAKGLGFVGKGCIHPRQIPILHRAFAPTPEEIEKARRIVAAFREAEARGDGVVALGSKMIDAPVVKRALKTVETAARLGLIAPEDDGEDEDA